jgi:hypothetical protein
MIKETYDSILGTYRAKHYPQGYELETLNKGRLVKYRVEENENGEREWVLEGKKEENTIERLLDYLGKLGSYVCFSPCDFSEGHEHYATIDFVSTVEIAGSLEKEINEELNEQNGFRAKLRIIDQSDLKHQNRFIYVGEIVPDGWELQRKITPRQATDATEHFLRSLPKAIMNFRKKHHRRR